MVARVVYRVMFTIGVAAFLAAFAAGVVQSWNTDGTLPELALDELGQGRAAVAAGDRQTAIRELEAYASITSGVADGWMRLGAFLAKSPTDRRAAIAAFERSLQALPAPVEAHESLALLYFQEGDLEAAREHARIAEQNGIELPAELRQSLGLGSE